MSQTVQGGSRRRDLLGVHSLDHFCFEVPDLAVARHFYEAFGLDVRGDGDRLELYAYGHPHRWGLVLKGEAKRVAHASFGIFADEADTFRSHLAGLGVALADRPGYAADGGIWFRDPHGLLVEVRPAIKSSPDSPSLPSPAMAGTPRRHCPFRGDLGVIRPRRLSHALFFTPDIVRSIDYYAEVLGLRLSDHSGPVAFMHGVHGSDHHLVAFAQANNGIGFHHSSWDVGSIDEVGAGASQMAAAGYAEGWGMGRHVLGSNYFHYVRDPWGSFAEYSFDIDYIACGDDWSETTPPPENALSLWGPAPHPHFTTNFEQPAAFAGVQDGH
jgi:catechol 2,3-dioxygenase-like lactoylglutathione lyase family enzyme